MLRLSGIKKSYYDKLVLQVDDFTIINGIHWLKGVNGSGKTTLLKIISSLIPFDGDVRLNDISLKSNTLAFRRLVSFAEAEPLFPSFLTGMDLVKFHQQVRNDSSENVSHLIAFSGLGHALRNPVGTYSSGMVKRLSLLLAFIGHVSLILLDEPLSTLDAEGMQALPGLIDHYHRQYHTSFILSSHQSLPAELNIDSQYRITNHTIDELYED